MESEYDADEEHAASSSDSRLCEAQSLSSQETQWSEYIPLAENVPIDANFCERCNGIIAFLDQEVTILNDFEMRYEKEQWYDPIIDGTSRSWYRLEVAAFIGCSLCAILFDILSLEKLSGVILNSESHNRITTTFSSVDPVRIMASDAANNFLHENYELMIIREISRPEGTNISSTTAYIVSF